MRALFFITFTATLSGSSAQTVTSVQNGFWNQASTWDCACVPDFTQHVVIMHSVEITAPLLMGHAQVQVTSSGEITMSFPETVSFNTVLINEGHVLVMGDILNEGLFNNVGVAEFIGTVLNDGTIVSDAGALIQVEGDFVNQDLVQGAGAICVSDHTANSGAISGTLDFCDWSPTVSEAPFIDQNTGTVEAGITYCTMGPCVASVDDSRDTAAIRLTPSIGADLFALTGVPARAVVLLMDATGRIALTPSTSAFDRLDLDLSGLPNGTYRLVVHTSAGQRVLPLVITR